MVERSLRPLVGLAGDGSHESREQAFAAWRRLVEAMADRRPTVLVFEDLHWADEGLLDFIDHLVDWSTGTPLLCVCTARPELLERRPGWGGGQLNSTTIAITALSEDETHELLAGLLGRTVLPAELLHFAGGNPLYAEEYARMLADRGLEETALPETVQGIIAARLDALSVTRRRRSRTAPSSGRFSGPARSRRWTAAIRTRSPYIRSCARSSSAASAGPPWRTGRVCVPPRARP